MALWERGRGDVRVAGEVDTLGRLLLFSIRRAPISAALLVLSTMVSITIALLFPAALAGAVDEVLIGARPGPALAWLGILLGASVLGDVLGGWAGSSASAAVGLSLRRGFTRRVLAAGIPGQRRFAAGDLASRLVAGALTASGMVSTVLSVAGTVVLALGGVVALALIDWTLAVAFVVCVPVAAVCIRRFLVESSEVIKHYQRLQGALSARLVEALSGSRTIRASGTVDREVERILAPLPELTEAGRANWEIQRRAVWKVSMLGPLVSIVVLALAGIGVSDGRITPGSWIAAAGYVSMALGSLGVVDRLMDVAHTRAGRDRLAEVLALPAGPGGSRALPRGPGAITFRSVTARAGDEVVLDGLDLDIPAGKSVAVVGRSGAGKSTFAALAGGLLAPDRGAVLLDGVPVAELRPDQLRAAVAYAFERPALLGQTVHDAIAYGCAGASRDQVELAALLVSADGFIRKLPDGYDTPLDRAPFSGGEAQRVGLARAVVGERRVLIVDDATSSLDTATEAEVTATLSRLLAGRTRIIVAHRVATAARADLVAWLENGRVRAVGRHELLWREPGYRALFGAEPA